MPTRTASRTRLEQSLTAVLEISQVINLSLGLRPMLQLLAEKVHSLMSYDCAVILLEPGSLLLTWAGYYGISNEYVRAMNAQGNNLATPEMAEGATGRAFRSREPVQITDFGDRSVRLWREMAEREGFVSFIATPMVFHERVVGFINCYTRQRHVFSPPEVELLRIIGNQAAIAVEAARSFGEEQQRARELNEANRALGEQRQLLESQYEQLRQGEQIHQQLTEVILGDLGLEAVVQRIADLTARPVHVYDAHLRHLVAARAEPPVDAFHAACLSTGCFAPGAWTARSGAGAVAPDAAQAVRVDCSADRGRYDRYLVPVTTGGTVLGYMVVVEAPEPLEGLALRAVEHGATVLALELLKQRAISQVEQQLRGSFLDDLIGGDYESEEAVTRRARHLGFDLRRTYRVLAVALDPLPGSVGEPAPPSEEMQRQLVDLGLVMCQAYWPGGVVTRRSDMLVIVRPEDPAGAAVAGVASEMLRAEATRSLGDRTVSVGIGSACHRIEDFSRSFAEARYCLELVYRFGNVDRSLAIDELGLHRFLIGSQSQTQLSQFAHQRLDRLIQYDRRRRGELLETLTAYLAAECSLLRTAEALVLHVNTVQYRLHRIEQLTGARLRGPDGLMEIHLALLIAFLNPREFPEVKDLTFFCRPR